MQTGGNRGRYVCTRMVKGLVTLRMSDTTRATFNWQLTT